MSSLARENQSMCRHEFREFRLTVHRRLITIYDSKISLKWTGTTLDGTEVNGSLTIPEVSHEITLDKLSDYIVCTSPSLFHDVAFHSGLFFTLMTVQLDAIDCFNAGSKCCVRTGQVSLTGGTRDEVHGISKSINRNPR